LLTVGGQPAFGRGAVRVRWWASCIVAAAVAAALYGFVVKSGNEPRRSSQVDSDQRGDVPPLEPASERETVVDGVEAASPRFVPPGDVDESVPEESIRSLRSVDLGVLSIREAIKVLVGRIQGGGEPAPAAADDLKELANWQGRDLPLDEQDQEVLARIAFEGELDARAVAVMGILRVAGREEARILERALSALQGSDGALDAALIGVIGRMSVDDVRIDATLRKALASGRRDVVDSAICAIREARPRLQRDTLLELVDVVRKGDDASLRGGALVALESLGDRAAMAGDVLWSAVVECDVERLPVFLRAYSAIAEDAPVRMLGYLGSEDVRVRVAALRGLGSRGKLSAEGEAALIAGLGDDDTGVRLACLETLMLGEPHTEEAVLGSLRYWAALWDSVAREGWRARRDAELLTALRLAARHPVRDARVRMALGSIVAGTRRGDPSEIGLLGRDLRAEAPWAWWRAGGDDREAALAIVGAMRGLEGQPGQVTALERVAAILNDGGREKKHAARAEVVVALAGSGVLDPAGQLSRASLSAAARQLIAEAASDLARSER